MKGDDKESCSKEPQGEKEEKVSSEESLEVAEKLQIKLDLDEPIEITIVSPDQKNNNPTPVKSEEPKEIADEEPVKELPSSSSSSSSSPGRGLDRRKSDSSQEISSPTERKDPFEVHYSASVNYNNNICEEKGEELKDDLEVSITFAPEKEVAMKHPLQHTWTLWWFSNKSKTWKAEEIISFSTIEDFWGAYNWIQPASRLGINSDYAVFKKGIQPDWEDHNNALGGRWVIERTRTEDMDTYWLETLFMLIGEHMEPHSDLINGAVVQRKKGKFRLALWLKESASWSERGIAFIGSYLKNMLNIPDSDSLDFRVHSAEQKRPVGRPGGRLSLNTSTLFTI